MVMPTYEFSAKVHGLIDAPDMEVARELLCHQLLCFGQKVYVFVKPQGETHDNLYEEIHQQRKYGRWCADSMEGNVGATTLSTQEGA